MKTSTVGIVSVAILMVVAGVGFGMAQARGPVETGAVPVMVSEESWMKDYGND